MIIVAILLVALVLRLYRLDLLPADFWGDINTHYELAQRILDGKFFFNYDFGGDGPLISYFIAATAKIFGLNFYSIKLTTVIVGVLSTFVLYYLALELFQKKEVAYISAFLLAVSFWSISLSRQGKPYILVPLFVMLVVLFLLKKKNFLSGIFLGLGMYTQVSFWGMFVFAFFNPLTFLGSIISSSRFFFDISSNINFYFNKSAYIGEKMGMSLTLGEKLIRLGDNILKNLMSFNFRGDTVFRHNISGNPHLDIVSGDFFVIGFLMIIFKTIKEKDRKLLKYFFLPFVFAQLPSILDINNPLNVPNLGRMVGAAPFAYMAAAYAMDKMKKNRKYLLIVLLPTIFYLNFRNYFYIYPTGLPNNNTPFAKIIASAMEKYPDNITVAVVGCCWDEVGQPEWTSIVHSLKVNKKILFFNQGENSKQLSCKSLKDESANKKIVLFSAPEDVETELKLSNCLQKKIFNKLTRKGWKVAKIVEGEL